LKPLGLLAEGCQAAADRFGLSINTIRGNIRTIYGKLHVPLPGGGSAQGREKRDHLREAESRNAACGLRRHCRTE
jgi:hypothetical protein